MTTRLKISRLSEYSKCCSVKSSQKKTSLSACCQYSSPREATSLTSLCGLLKFLSTQSYTEGLGRNEALIHKSSEKVCVRRPEIPVQMLHPKLMSLRH